MALIRPSILPWNRFVITPGKGVRFAVDVGTVRIGLARTDRDQIMALPVSTIEANLDAVAKVSELAKDFQAEVIYVGKPIGLKAAHTDSTEMAEKFATQLALTSEIEVRLLDERLTTVSAQSALHASGKSAKQGRGVIDQVAAVILLDHAMAIENSTGTLAGEIVSPEQSEL